MTGSRFESADIFWNSGLLMLLRSCRIQRLEALPGPIVRRPELSSWTYGIGLKDLASGSE
jgi:hypothetical protein